MVRPDTLLRGPLDSFRSSLQLHNLKHFLARFVALLFVTLLFLPSIARAQDLAGIEQGIKPYGAYHGGDIDSISMVNGGLALHIPLVSYPQRGGKLSMGYSVIYWNPFYTNTDNCYNNPLPNCVPVQWTYHLTYGGQYPNGGGAGIAIVPDFYRTVANHLVNGHNDGFEVHEPDGGIHLMGSSVAISMDATGYSYLYNPSVGTYGTGTLIDRQGTRNYISYENSSVGPVPYMISGVEDINGNTLTPNVDPSLGITGWTDTLGRLIPEPAFGTATSDYSGCSGSQPTVSAKIWAPPGPNGGTLQFKFCYARFPVSYTPSGCSTNCTGIALNNVQIQSIVTYNGVSWTTSLAWTFEIDTTGALTKIGFPTGGSISYTWNTNSSACMIQPDFHDNYGTSATSRTVDANDGTGGHPWKYALSWPSGGIQTVVTDPNLNDAVHTISFGSGGCSGYETELDQYAGSYTAGTGTLLRKTTTVFNSSPDPLQSGLLINVVPLSVTTTDVLTGKTSQIAKTYDAGIPMSGTNVLYGNVMTEKDTDFGNGTPGAVLRTTSTQYLAFSNSNYLNNNLLDLVSQQAVFAGNSVSGGCSTNGALSCATYGYDESALSSSSVTMQHDAAPPGGSYRGNPTSVHRWFNGSTVSQAPCLVSVSNGYLVSANVFF